MSGEPVRRDALIVRDAESDQYAECERRGEPLFSANGRLALRKQEAAAALGISDESFDRYVLPDVRVVRRGALRLYPVPELERWLRDSAELPLGGPDATG